jgi:hypothetical protein
VEKLKRDNPEAVRWWVRLPLRRIALLPQRLLECLFGDPRPVSAGADQHYLLLTPRAPSSPSPFPAVTHTY